MMAGQGFTPHLLHIKHKNGQPAPRRDFAVFLPKGTGRCIARILKRRLIVQFLLFHQAAERRMRHVNFSAHLQELRCIVQPFRNGFYRGQIGGHIFAHHTIATGGTAHQPALFILQDY